MSGKSNRGEVSQMSVMGAVFNLNHPAHTVDWNFIHLSVANVVVIGLMLVVFVLAILLPFPGAAARDAGRNGDARRRRASPGFVRRGGGSS
jgi:hypothetical protein